MTKEAIILAGGFGTRLKSVVKDIPKPMALVKGRPFLAYVLEFVARHGIQKVILSVAYKSEQVKAHFGHKFEGMELAYSIEKEPLGTGGGIRKAMEQVEGKRFFVLNGDTLFTADLKMLYRFHKDKKADISLALKEMKDFDRYGTVIINKNKKITSFQEKEFQESGLINGGIYLVNKKLLERLPVGEKFSFEKAILETYYVEKRLFGFLQDQYFIDIGIPEDYRRAEQDFPIKWVESNKRHIL